MARVSVCFVCLGNICRSPTAEGVFRRLVADADLDAALEIDSAGTAAYHEGEPPDRRSAATARKRGFPLGGRARRFRASDFERFDYVIAMDRSNRDDLLDLAPDAAARDKVAMLRDFDAEADPGADVPDPYYGGDRGFETVVDICERSCRAFLEALQRDHDLRPHR